MELDPNVCTLNSPICLSNNNSNENNDTQQGPIRRMWTAIISNNKMSNDAALPDVGHFQITMASAAWQITNQLSDKCVISHIVTRLLSGSEAISTHTG